MSFLRQLYTRWSHTWSGRTRVESFESEGSPSKHLALHAVDEITCASVHAKLRAAVMTCSYPSHRRPVYRLNHFFDCAKLVLLHDRQHSRVRTGNVTYSIEQAPE